MDRTEELIAKIQAVAEAGRVIAEKAETDGWTAESRAEVAAHLEQAKTLKGQLDDQKDGGELRRLLKDLADDIGTPPAPAPDPGAHRPLGAAGQSLGAAFVESEQYKAFRRQFPTGRIPERARVNMDPVDFKTIVGKQNDGGPGLISVTGTSGLSGGLVQSDYQGLLDTLGRPDLNVRNLVSVRTTTSDLIEYVRQLTRYPAADWVPEASDLDPAAFPSGETGIKPMGGFDFEVVTAPVDTVAEWIPVTKRAVMDAPQLRGMIDQELRGNLADAEERALLYGGGANGVIEGLDDTDGVQAQAFDTDLFVTTRKARSKVRYGGFATPTAYLMNIDDDEAIDLERDANGRFYGLGPFAMGPQTLWGLPRLASQYVNEGEAWVGDWRRAVIWDRQQATISISDSHADFFIRNLLAVLGEQREAFGIIRPAAFVKIATG